MCKSNWMRHLFSISGMVVLSMACGGGGGSNEGSTPTSTPTSGLTAVLNVEPSLSIEVGEEIFISGMKTTYDDNQLLRKARFEWDFGDGFTYMFGVPAHYSAYSSPAVTHFFMKPGDYSVKLTVSIFDRWDGEGTPTAQAIATSTASKTIHVTGVVPLAGFELMHAPMHARLAQYVYASIPAAYQGNTTTLRVSLVGPQTTTTTLFAKSSLKEEECFLLDHKPLAKGDYVLVAELLDGSLHRIPGAVWCQKFSKPYSGLPKVGIDENNSFRVNGELFFPIGTYMTDVPNIASYKILGGMNTLHTEGYYDTHSASTWNNYLSQAATNGLMAIGPHRGDYAAVPTTVINRWQFNHDVDRMAEYVRLTKDKPAMFGWSWQDEPNNGGQAQKAYLPTMAAWNYVSFREDPQHPSFTTLGGYDYLKWHNYTEPTNFDYLGSASLFGGKKWQNDAFVFDIYPLHYRLRLDLDSADTGPYALYLDALDRIHKYNKGLVPVIPTLEPCEEVPGDTTTPGPTDDQVYMEAWFNVVHGAKAILWFQYFDTPSIRWNGMKRFADQMSVLAPVMLSATPARTVTDDANAPLNRVDVMLRERNGVIYLIAVRVTEPDPIAAASYTGIEPGSITVNFKISGLTGVETAAVIDELRDVTLSNGTFSDTFAKNTVHIYRITP